jgi:predicted enzyme related to lactoylglutathione lyase
MPSRWSHTVIDAADTLGQARFWMQVLDWQLINDDPDEPTIGPPDDAGRGPHLLFMPVAEGKAVKNRLHIDLRPDDQDAEVERIIGLGARRVDVGQTGEESWVVLADPEGNEFCVLRARP